MINILFILLIIGLAGWGFSRQNARYVRNRRLQQQQETLRRSFKKDDLSPDDLQTIKLIGENAFRDMARRIDDIMRRHAMHKGLALNLTCGPDSSDGADCLHRLLPGSVLQLNLCNEGGVEWIDVYHNGNRIGRLALMEAAVLKDVMKTNILRAAYVAEQNCYGIEDSHNLTIIVFYEPRSEAETEIRNFFNASKQNSEDGKAIIDICQN